ncbi:hypothetical protein [Shewanella sp.]|uniref:hypothetical protein n=1 Tax=Shewanella sp. TaxID=50422 RepID=UPI0040489463
MNNPTTRAIIAELVAAGCEVIVWCRKNHKVNNGTLGIKYKEDNFVWWATKAILINKLSWRWPTNLVSYIDRFRFKVNDYSMILSVDRLGVIEAAGLNKKLRLEHHHISYEILFKSETSEKFKKLERIALKDVNDVLIQDKLRRKHFSIENSLSEEIIYTVPLAFTKIPPEQRKNIRLRDQLGIPGDKNLLAFIGSVTEWSMINEVIEVMPKLSKQWCLLVNDRFGFDNTNLNDRVGDLGVGDRVYINREPVLDIRDMDYILNGCDYGLAFYKPSRRSKYTGKNLEYIGLASGKISTYLRSNVPVITNANGEIAEHIRRYNAGIVIGHPNEMIEIDNNKSEQNGALSLFSEVLAFENHKEKVLNVLKFERIGIA